MEEKKHNRLVLNVVFALGFVFGSLIGLCFGLVIGMSDSG